MKRHCESESRYLEQDQLRKDIEYANIIFHYVWFIRSRQRNSNPIKQQTMSPLTDYNPLHSSSIPVSDVRGASKKSIRNVSNQKSHSALKSSKRLKHSQTNKPVSNKTPVRPTSPPKNTFDSPIPSSLSLPAPQGKFHTPDLNNTPNTVENFSFPFPVSDYATYPELSNIPCFISCLQDPPIAAQSSDEVAKFGSMVEWNNLNI